MQRLVSGFIIIITIIITIILLFVLFGSVGVWPIEFVVFFITST